MAVSAKEIMERRKAVAERSFDQVELKIDRKLQDPESGYFGQPVVFNVQELYDGLPNYWPFIFEIIVQKYARAGFEVTMGECKTKISFAAAPPKAEAT